MPGLGLQGLGDFANRAAQLLDQCNCRLGSSPRRGTHTKPLPLATWNGLERQAPTARGQPSALPGLAVFCRLPRALHEPSASLASSFCPLATHLEAPAGPSAETRPRSTRELRRGRTFPSPTLRSKCCPSLSHTEPVFPSLWDL